jgi:hypothetical protein
MRGGKKAQILGVWLACLWFNCVGNLCPPPGEAPLDHPGLPVCPAVAHDAWGYEGGALAKCDALSTPTDGWLRDHGDYATTPPTAWLLRLLRLAARRLRDFCGDYGWLRDYGGYDHGDRSNQPPPAGYPKRRRKAYR